MSTLQVLCFSARALGEKPALIDGPSGRALS
jgi:hypothetical protein